MWGACRHHDCLQSYKWEEIFFLRRSQELVDQIHLQSVLGNSQLFSETQPVALAESQQYCCNGRLSMTMLGTGNLIFTQIRVFIITTAQSQGTSTCMLVNSYFLDRSTSLEHRKEVFMEAYLSESDIAFVVINKPCGKKMNHNWPCSCGDAYQEICYSVTFSEFDTVSHNYR